MLLDPGSSSSWSHTSDGCTAAILWTHFNFNHVEESHWTNRKLPEAIPGLVLGDIIAIAAVWYMDGLFRVSTHTFITMGKSEDVLPLVNRMQATYLNYSVRTSTSSVCSFIQSFWLQRSY